MVQQKTRFGGFFVGHAQQPARTSLCCLQKELYFYGLEWEDDASVLNAVEHPRIEQCGYIAVNGFYVTSNAAGSFAD